MHRRWILVAGPSRQSCARRPVRGAAACAANHPGRGFRAWAQWARSSRWASSRRGRCSATTEPPTTTAAATRRGTLTAATATCRRGTRFRVDSTSRPRLRRQHRHVLSRRVLQFGAARRVEVRSRSTRRSRARAALGAVRPRAPGAAASRGGAEHMSQELRLGRSLSARAAASRARARSAQSCGQRKLR